MIFYGKSVLGAQRFTKSALYFLSDSQSSCIVSGKDLSTNYYIGNAYFPGSTTPVIETVDAKKKQESKCVVEISAKLSTPSQLVQHVWAFIHAAPKNHQISQFAITELPHLELTIDLNNHDRYTGTFASGIDKTQPYSIGVYAMNPDGMISLPMSIHLE